MRRLLPLIIAAILVIFAPVRLNAQSGGTLEYGNSAIGRLSTSSPTLLYSFNGTAGDHFQARALSMAPGMGLTLSLIGPNQQALTASQPSPFSSGDLDAALNFELPETATYGLLVSMNPESQPINEGGEFMLQISRNTPSEAPPELALTTATELDVLANEAPVRRSFEADPDCPTTLYFANHSPDGALLALRVLDAENNVLNSVLGIPHSSFTVPAGSGTYTVEVLPLYAGQGGVVALGLSCSGEASPIVETPIVAPLPAPVFAPPAGAFMMVQSGGVIDPGRGVLGTIIQGSPLISYSFDGQAGDVITAEAISFLQDMDLTLALLSPSVQPIAFSDNGAFGFNSTDSSVTLTLPETGMYSLLVGMNGEIGGAYVLRLLEHLAEPSVPIPPNTPLALDFSAFAGESSVQYAFSALDCPTSVSLAAANGSGIPIFARLLDSTGQLVSFVDSTSSLGKNDLLPPNSGRYLLELAAPPSSEQGFSLVIACADDVTAASDASTPEATTSNSGAATATLRPTETRTATRAASSASNCTVSTDNAVNVRGGPGTNFSVLGTLQPGQSFPIIGIDANGAWYRIDFNGPAGWVAVAIVQSSGGCGNLPVSDVAGNSAPTSSVPTPVPPTNPPAQGQNPPTTPPTAVPGQPTTAPVVPTNAPVVPTSVPVIPTAVPPTAVPPTPIPPTPIPPTAPPTAVPPTSPPPTPIGPVCGNGACEQPEDYSSCSSDCPFGAVCGDGVCSVWFDCDC